MKLFYDETKPHQLRNIEWFRELVAANPEIKFFQPSPLKAPWHVQVELKNDSGAPILVNFWPHKGKAYCAETGKASGVVQVCLLLRQAIILNSERCRS